MEPIFETGIWLNNRITVYPDKIVYITGLSFIKKEEIVLINQIADIEMPTIKPEMKIRTTGGREYKLIVKKADKEKLRDAILQAQSVK